MGLRTYIRGYENYMITTHGEVFNVNTRKYLKNVEDGRGYYFVTLYKDGKGKNYRIHYLVASHFINNKENKPQVNHIDGNKLNNNVKNLEWATPSENIKHSWATGLSKSSELQKEKARQMCIELKSKKVIDTLNGKIYKSASDASKKLNINVNTLRGYLTNFRKNTTSLKYI